MPNLIETIKKAAVEAVEASKPSKVLFGQVVSAAPLKIKVEQRLTLDESHLILTNLVKNFEVDMTVDAVRKTYTVHLGLAVGEPVVLLQVQGGQKYVVLDRGDS